MDVHCSTCNEPWDVYHLWHEAIFETGLSVEEAEAWRTLPQTEKLSERYRAEFMHDLHARPPEYVVVSTGQAARIVGRAVRLEEFPAFFEFLRGGYQKVTEFDELELYRRKR